MAAPITTKLRISAWLSNCFRYFSTLVFREIYNKKKKVWGPKIAPKCIKGPSGPIARPEATLRISATALMIKVFKSNRPRIQEPAGNSVVNNYYYITL